MMNRNSSKIRFELSLDAKSIKKAGVFRKNLPDPYAIVTQNYINAITGLNENVVTIGRTETIKNTVSPVWTTKFFVDYTIGKPLKLHVSIYDEKHKSSNSDKTSEMVGCITFPISNLNVDLHDMNKTKTEIKKFSLKSNNGKKKDGFVTLRLKNIPDKCFRRLCLDLQAIDLSENPNPNFFSIVDPFLEIFREEEKDYGYDEPSYSPVYRTEYISANYSSPHWKPFTLSLGTLLNYTNDFNKSISILVHDYNKKSGNHYYMGSVKATVNILLATAKAANSSLPIYNNKGEVCGRLLLHTAKIISNDKSNVNSTAVGSNESFTDLKELDILSPPNIGLPHIHDRTKNGSSSMCSTYSSASKSNQAQEVPNNHPKYISVSYSHNPYSEASAPPSYNPNYDGTHQ